MTYLHKDFGFQRFFCTLVFGIIVSLLPSQAYAITNTPFIKNLKHPLITAVHVPSFESCTESCTIAIKGKNFIPTSDRVGYKTHVIVEKLSPDTRFIYEFTAQQLDDESVFVRNSRLIRADIGSMIYINGLKVTVVNEIAGREFSSNTFDVSLEGIPEVPVISSLDIGSQLYISGESFNTPDNTELFFSKVFVGNIDPHGDFEPLGTVAFQYNDSSQLVVSLAAIAQFQGDLFMLVTNHNSQTANYTASEMMDLPPVVLQEVCHDGQDNDNDSLVDCADSDCHLQTGPSGYVCEYNMELSCIDNFDNDADGRVDCNDTDCSSSADCVPQIELICDDGLDNDADGLTDCLDEDCHGKNLCSFENENGLCSDGFDNDADGAIDCADSDCALDPACLSAGVNGDICSNYNTGAMNKPQNFPSYHSMLTESWNWRRDVNGLPASQIVKVGGPNPNFTSLKTAFTQTACGKTILVYGLQGSENNYVQLQNKQCSQNSPIHIMFMNELVIGPPAWSGGDVINIDNVTGLVLDGMNNLKLMTDGTQAPRSLLFVGHMGGGCTSVNDVVVKNMELDGGNYGGANALGAKWGLMTEAVTDFAICNLNIHNIRMEHGIYQHDICGSNMVVHNKMDTVGRTCTQKRTDYHTMDPNAIYVVADNVCSNSAQAGAITVHDAGEQIFVHGNTVQKSVQCFASGDSKQTGAQNHTAGNVYFYDNACYQNDKPKHCNGYGQYCDNFKPMFLTEDQGAQFHIQNNVFIMGPNNSNNSFFSKDYNSENKNYLTGNNPNFPSYWVDIDNNVYGLAHPSNMNNPNPYMGDWGGFQSYTYGVGLNKLQWKAEMPSVEKPAFGLNSQFINDPTLIQDLKDQYWP